jgi:hypothetical protein
MTWPRRNTVPFQTFRGQTSRKRILKHFRKLTQQIESPNGISLHGGPASSQVGQTTLAPETKLRQRPSQVEQSHTPRDGSPSGTHALLSRPSISTVRQTTQSQISLPQLEIDSEATQDCSQSCVSCLSDHYATLTIMQDANILKHKSFIKYAINLGNISITYHFIGL